MNDTGLLKERKASGKRPKHHDCAAQSHRSLKGRPLIEVQVNLGAHGRPMQALT